LSSTGETAGGAPPGQPSDEELRAAYEAELARITSTDMIAQSAISLLNLGALRMAPADAGAAVERDLEQASDAIDAARALLEILERRIPGELAPLRDALSRLQMAYAKEVREAAAPAAQDAGGGEEPGGGQGPGGEGSGGEGSGGEGTGGGGEGAQQQPGEQGQRRPGPAESSGRLWVPGT
jgi:hypothetical protein